MCVEAKKRALSYSVDPQLLSSPVGFELSLSLCLFLLFSFYFLFYLIETLVAAKTEKNKQNKQQNLSSSLSVLFWFKQIRVSSKDTHIITKKCWQKKKGK